MSIELKVKQERIYDKIDLLKEHAKMSQPDVGRILQLLNQVESLVESIDSEDIATAS